MVKNNILVFVFAFTFFVSADQKSEIEKSYQNILHIKEHLSVNKKANIYKVIASSDDLSLSSVTIDIPKEDNIKFYRTPSKRDKYIIKILDENNRELSVIGLQNPFIFIFNIVDMRTRMFSVAILKGNLIYQFL